MVRVAQKKDTRSVMISTFSRKITVILRRLWNSFLVREIVLVAGEKLFKKPVLAEHTANELQLQQ